MATKLSKHQQWILDEARRVLDGAESRAMFVTKFGHLMLKYGSGISSSTLKAMERKGVVRTIGYSGHDFVLVDAEPAAIAQPADAPTVNAEPWTPVFQTLPPQHWWHLIDPRETVLLPEDSPFLEQLTDVHMDAWFIEPSSHTQYVVWKLVGENTYQIGIRYDEPTPEKLDAFKRWVLAQHEEPAASADAVNAADVGEVDDISTLPPFSPSEIDYDNALKMIDPRDAQIAALTRDLADAVAVIREVEDLLMQNGHHTPTVRLADQVNDVFRTLSAVSDTLADVREERDALERELEAVKQMFDGYQAASLDTLDDVQQYRGWIGELIDHLDHISPMEALTRLLSFRRDYQAYTARNEEHTAAMVAALRSRDNGNRVSADNVLAMFADGEDGTIA